MLIPALDLIDGKVVRLKQGDFAQQTTFHDNPVPVAQRYAAAGAKWLHLVDLDGARDPAKRQLQVIQNIIEQTSSEQTNSKQTDMAVQVGGGIRTTEDIERLLAIGVQRVVIGSTAVNQPELVLQWFQQFGAEAIVLAIDVNINAQGDAMVATHGWLESSDKTLQQVLRPYLAVGCRHVLCTDISRDGMLSGSNIDLYASLKREFPEILWQASGGIASLTDLEQLQAVNCDSAILGKSLLAGQFTLEEALACWPNA